MFRYGHLGVVELLLAAPGIDIDQLNQVETAPCPFPLAPSPCPFPLPPFPLVFTPTPSPFPQAGKNAVMYAAQEGRVEVCRLLLEGAERSWTSLPSRNSIVLLHTLFYPSRHCIILLHTVFYPSINCFILWSNFATPPSRYCFITPRTILPLQLLLTDCPVGFTTSTT